MPIRITIEHVADQAGQGMYRCDMSVVCFDPSIKCTAEQVGCMIGKALNAVDRFVTPGDVLGGIVETLDSDVYFERPG